MVVSEVYVLTGYFSENTRPVSFIGPNATDAAMFTNRDDTSSSIFIPSTATAVKRDGNISTWTAAFIDDVEEIFFQVLHRLVHNPITVRYRLNIVFYIFCRYGGLGTP